MSLLLSLVLHEAVQAFVSLISKSVCFRLLPHVLYKLGTQLYVQDPRDRVYNEATVAEDMLEFLQAFLEGNVFERSSMHGHCMRSAREGFVAFVGKTSLAA